MDQPPRERPWLPWAIGSLLLLLGFAAGWMGVALPAERLSEPGPSTAAQARVPRTHQADQARVDGSPVILEGRPGTAVDVAFTVTNTGDGPWTAYAYRFVPSGEGLVPVLPLPGDVKAGASAVVKATLWIPPVVSPWLPAWELTGPQGPVPGGRLEARVTIRTESPAADEP